MGEERKAPSADVTRSVAHPDGCGYRIDPRTGVGSCVPECPVQTGFRWGSDKHDSHAAILVAPTRPAFRTEWHGWEFGVVRTGEQEAA